VSSSFSASASRAGLHRACGPGQLQRECRGPQAAPGALEQYLAQLGFQIRDMAPGRRLADAQLPGRAQQAATLQGSQESGQQAPVERGIHYLQFWCV
jgi:hypothetical protein